MMATITGFTIKAITSMVETTITGFTIKAITSMVETSETSRLPYVVKIAIPLVETALKTSPHNT